MKHCCDNMEYYATIKNSLLEYSPEDRGYNFLITHTTRGTHQSMEYCPWCGTKLPEDLGEKWVAVIKEELGYDDPFFELGYDNLPEEFRTDAWWKKRGL